MRTINKIEILGRLGAEPELKCSESGDVIACRLKIVTDRKDGNSDWHNAIAFSKLADLAVRSKQGDYVYIAGEVRYNKVMNGQPRYYTDIIVHDYVFLGNECGKLFVNNNK